LGEESLVGATGSLVGSTEEFSKVPEEVEVVVLSELRRLLTTTYP
jgi:hypothetical protein